MHTICILEMRHLSLKVWPHLCKPINPEASHSLHNQTQIFCSPPLNPRYFCHSAVHEELPVINVAGIETSLIRLLLTARLGIFEQLLAIGSQEG